MRINERELRRPKYFAEIKPNRTACDQESFKWPERNKHPGALMIFLPPNSHQTDTEREDNERSNLQERTAPDRLFFQPEDQKQGRGQCAGRGFRSEREQTQSKRGKIKNSAMLAPRIDIFDPDQQSKQKEESHQNILQLRNPGDRLNLDWVECKNCRCQPGAGNFQASKKTPDKKSVGQVK